MTGKLKIKYMVQSRQLRKTHIDSYYCATYYHYLSLQSNTEIMLI